MSAGTYVHAAREAIGERDVEGGGYAAYKMLEKGEDLIEQGETDRGIKMLETVIKQNPRDKMRFRAYLALGKYYLEARDNPKAILNLRNTANIELETKVLKGKDLELYLEGLYLTGIAYFNSRQYGAAFSVLRKITNGYPNTLWANQAYYYIGMSHYAQRNWSKAIKNLSLVGTFIDPESPAVEYVEAGHRFYVKVNDGDLPLLKRLGMDLTVTATAKSGDSEKIACTQQNDEGDIYVGSVRTEVGKGTKGDNILNLVGGDTIDVTYVDDSTKDGGKNVKRVKTVKVVSGGTITFTRGTYKFKTESAFLAQPVFVRLKDVDLDKTPGKDTATVVVSSSYEIEEDEDEEIPTMTVDLEKLMQEQKEKRKVRDEVKLTLTEDAPHSGVFTGTTMINRAPEDAQISKTDSVLSSEVGDKLAVVFIDELNIKGEVPEERKSMITVFDEIDSKPTVDQDVVAEAVTKAQKQIVEAEAYLEIAKIFQSMGLKQGAENKSDQGLERVKFPIETRAAIPQDLREHAFAIKLDLYLAQEDFTRAMGVCSAFKKLFPESAYADAALMGIGRIYLNKGDYKQAIGIFNRVSRLANSHSQAEAAFLVAKTTEKMHEGDRALDAAIPKYKDCAQRFPDSEYAGPSLAKVIDYHVKTKDYAKADDLLTEVFLDYQDEDFLDSMLMQWVQVAYDMGDYSKAEEKCRQLLIEYPGSVHAQKAQDTLPMIQEKLNDSTDEETTQPEDTNKGV
jgi:TolA-binding protein